MGTVCDRPKIAKQKTFFRENTMKEEKINNFNFQNMKSKLKLEFTIENIEINHKFKIEAKFLDSQFTDVFTTEEVKSHNNIIIFNSCYICDYFFEKRQNLQISLIKDSQKEGTIQLPLGQIVGSRGSTFKQKIGNNSFIIITAQGISNENAYIEFNFSTQCISYFDFNKASDRISYLIASNGKKIYSSESISSYGNFEPKKIPVALIDRGFTVTFLDSNKKILGYRDESIQSFITSNGNVYLGLNVDKKQLNIINNSRFLKNYSFIDYIKNGVFIKLDIGIDFTASNNLPNDPKSLHYIYGNNPNDYEQAIRSCGDIVAYYDYNQSFPTYGFGAVVGNDNQPSMCFNINFKENPEIYSIDNVIEEYKKCFKNIQLAGPTLFCPMVRKVIEDIKGENNPLKYHILLILTDGIILDMQETIDALVEGSFLPLSVIIIGIGNDHFQEMIFLDADDDPLVSSNGTKTVRDLVQFVPFNKYKFNPEKLAEQVLEEVPRQITEYYTMNNIFPENLAMSRINNSLNMGNSIRNGSCKQSIYQSNMSNRITRNSTFSYSQRSNFNNMNNRESGYNSGGSSIYFH